MIARIQIVSSWENGISNVINSNTMPANNTDDANRRAFLAVSDTIESRPTMRLSDAGMRSQQPELIYPNHRLPPWPTEDTSPRDRSNRLLEDALRRTQAIKGTATTSLMWSVTKNTGWLFQMMGQIVELSEGIIAAAVASTAATNPNWTAFCRARTTAATATGRAAHNTAAV
jgi:hypothetical protein